jgi:hypothetical protein
MHVLDVHGMAELMSLQGRSLGRLDNALQPLSLATERVASYTSHGIANSLKHS